MVVGDEARWRSTRALGHCCCSRRQPWFPARNNARGRRCEREFRQEEEKRWGCEGGVLLEVVVGDDEVLDRELLSRSR